MEGVNSKLLIASLIFLIVSCSDNAPTGPYAARNSEIFPLAANAKWLYRVTYSSSSYSGSGRPFVTKKEFGCLEITVLGTIYENSKSEYELMVFNEIDSLYTQISGSDPAIRDTVYSQTAVSDTTYYKTVIYKNGYLWIETEDSLEQIMPAIASKGTKIDLRLFIPPTYKDFVPVLDYYNRNFQDGSVSYLFAEDYPVQPVRKSSASVFPDSGGIKEITFSFNERGYWKQDLNMRLKEYTPGSPE